MRPSYLVYASLMICCAPRLEAAEFFVDTTSDALLTACTAAPNDCSLRGALALANGVSVAHDVKFNIPMSDSGCVAATGVCTIRPGTPLPDINPNLAGIVTIDGETQPGTVRNTLTPAQGGTNAQLKIVITGTNCGLPGGCDVGLRFNRSGTTRGLVINGFRTNSSGIAVVPGFDNGGVVEGCFLGTDVTGMIAVPNSIGVAFGGNPFGGGTTTNGRVGGLMPAQRNLISGNIGGGGVQGSGIRLDGINHVVLGNLIGTNATGTAALGNENGMVLGGGANFFQLVGNAGADGRNVISGNIVAGIEIAAAGGSGLPTNGTRIRGNFIGTDVTGTLPLGNGTFGVHMRIGDSSQLPRVGGTAPGEGNVIAFNGGEGVGTRSDRSNVSRNRIFSNARLGISSQGGGRLPNDPEDADPVGNRAQNYPDISTFALAGGNVTLGYRVDSATANSAYPLRVEFFKADGDEGRDFVGSDSYLAGEAQSVKAISFAVPAGVTLSANDVIVASATDANGSNTSEFSFSPATLAIATPTSTPCSSADSVFCNGFEAGPQQSLLVRVGATATSGPFAPNGVVNVTDNRGGSCNLTLLPVATPPLSSEGTCILVNSGAAGAITITATLNTFRSAFGSADGGNVVAIGNFIVE